MDRMNRYRFLAGIIVFGSIWGMLECTIGSPGVSSSLGGLPAGAMLAGLFGLGLMVWTRRTYRIPGMQLGMALVAGMLRFVAPIGSCVICSALAIGAEGLVFEFIYSRPSLNINKLKDPATSDPRYCEDTQSAGRATTSAAERTSTSRNAHRERKRGLTPGTPGMELRGTSRT